MLEFYPMPTNLNNGGALYPHSHLNHHATSHHPAHQNHVTAARFFDNANNNINTTNINSNSNNNNNNNVSHNCNNPSAMPATTNLQTLIDNSNNSAQQQHQQQQQQQQQHLILPMTTTSPAYASCPPLTTNTLCRNIAVSPTNFSSSTSCETETSLAPQSAVVPPSTNVSVGPISAAVIPTSVKINLKTATSPTPASSTLSLATSASTVVSSSALTSVSASASSSSSSLTPTPSINPCTVVMLSAALAASTQCSSSSPTSALTSSISIKSSSSLLSASASAPTSATALSSAVDCNGRTEVGHIKCEKLFEICEGCGQKIHDRYLMNVGDSNWHEQCLACCYCGMQLHHTCYVRNTKLYCKLDYDRLFGIKCAACCHSILPHEMVMRPIPNFIFHLSCFVCFACRLPLQKGEQFMLRDGQLLCFRHDLEKEMYLAAAQHCGFVGLDEDELMRPRDGRRGPKRPRTILTSQQRKQFKASFDQSPKPCRKVREALAKDTGLSVRVVQVWFQNQRAKMKKIQRKAKNGSGSTTGNGGNGGNSSRSDDKDKDKDEKGVKQESVSGSESGYLGLDSAFASQPLNPNLPFSPDDYPANSNDSFCSSDLSLDGSNFDQLDDDADSLSLNNLELQSTGSSGNHHHHHHHHHHHSHHNHNHSHHNHHSNPHDMIANLNTSLINPIDKLYLMQNSYFNSEQ